MTHSISGRLGYYHNAVRFSLWVFREKSFVQRMNDIHIVFVCKPVKVIQSSYIGYCLEDPNFGLEDLRKWNGVDLFRLIVVGLILF